MNMKICDDKFEKFFTDIGIDIYEDITCIYILYKMKAEKMGEIKKEEFKEGCMTLGVDSIDKWKAKVPLLKWKQDESEYFAAYAYNYDVNCDEGMNVIETDTVVEMWKMWMIGRCKFLDQWLNFITEVKKPQKISKQEWTDLFELSKMTDDMSKFEDDGSVMWCGMIDDFAEHCGV